MSTNLIGSLNIFYLLIAHLLLLKMNIILNSGCDISTRQRQKCWASANHRALARLASTFFVAKKLFKLQNAQCVLHSILPKTDYFYFAKFYILNRLIKWRWKATLGFANNQIWLPPNGNYITQILAKSYTAGHYRATGDQVNMAPKERSWVSQVARISRRFIIKKIYIWNIKQVPPPCFLGV